MRALRLSLLPFLLLACSEVQGPPDQSPQFDFANAPDQSGIVYRDAGPAAWTFPDAATGFRVTFGVDMLDFCAGVGSFDELHWADKWLPEDRLVTINKMDDARTAVWPFLAFDCALFTTVQPLASGYTAFMYLDNDYFGSDNPNTDTWGFTAQGTLAWTADGSRAQFSFVRRLLWDKRTATRLVTQNLVLH